MLPNFPASLNHDRMHPSGCGAGRKVGLLIGVGVWLIAGTVGPAWGQGQPDLRSREQQDPVASYFQAVQRAARSEPDAAPSPLFPATGPGERLRFRPLMDGDEPIPSSLADASPSASLFTTASRLVTSTGEGATGEGATGEGATGERLAGERLAEATASRRGGPTWKPTSGLPPLGPPAVQSSGIAGSLGGTAYLPAEQPKADDRFGYAPPGMSALASLVPYSEYDFSPTPRHDETYDSWAQQGVYADKTLNRNQRPLVEWFKPWYQRGQLKPGNTLLGTHNPLIPQFLVYGDYRTGWATNTANGNQQSVWAHRLNLDFDLRLTSTERLHWFMTPLNRGLNFTRLVHDGDPTFVAELNPDVLFGYFEGDLGAMWGGVTNRSLPFDLPFAVGVMPLLFQNGVWLEDAFLGVAATIPARNSPLLDIANLDTTIFVGFDNITSPAFNNDDSAARMYGVATFIEAWGGYVELNYAYLQDRSDLDRGYHNSSVAFTRRFAAWLSHSFRVINNAGQNPTRIEQTADGTLLLWENSLITRHPYTRIPYFNFFLGFDRPQSVARDALSGGVLRNTGILFETDGLTGFPFLDDTAQNSAGGAVGLNLLADDFSQQLILETAAVVPLSGKVSTAGDPQYGFGLRYQIPLTNSVIFRSDAMVGIQESGDNLNGFRIELRKKW